MGATGTAQLSAQVKPLYESPPKKKKQAKKKPKRRK